MAVSKVLLEQDRYNKLVRTSNTVVTLGSQTVTTSISGVGGLDTGSIAASTLYYVYTVISSGVVRLIASTSAISPTGFSVYRKVGAFYTDASSNVFKAYFLGEQLINMLSARVSAAGAVNNGESQQPLVNGNATINVTSRYTLVFNTGVFAAAPSIVAISNNQPSNRNIVTTCEGIDASAVVIFTNNVNNNTATASDFMVVVKKTGIDAAQPDWSR